MHYSSVLGSAMQPEGELLVLVVLRRQTLLVRARLGAAYLSEEMIRRPRSSRLCMTGQTLMTNYLLACVQRRA